jgi:hypothetical protein
MQQMCFSSDYQIHIENDYDTEIYFKENTQHVNHV